MQAMRKGYLPAILLNYINKTELTKDTDISMGKPQIPYFE